MRTTIGLVLVLVAAACGTDGGTAGDDGSDGSGSGSDGSDNPPPARGFQIQSPDITIPAGVEVTYCYYFRTPNTEPMAIHKWASSMSPGSHHMILFTTGDKDVKPVGTVSSDDCGFTGGAALSSQPVWTYSAQTPEAELELPNDDGAGQPLAQVIQPNTAGFIQMHYLNTGDDALVVHTTLNGEALEASATFTETAAFVSYNNSIKIPAVTNNVTMTKTCSVPANKQFWLMSTHAHKQAKKTTVLNGMPTSTAVAFESTDWEHPGEAEWMDTPFYSFADNGNKLTYSCTYDNPTGREISAGDSAKTDEMCMATGYMFPATKPSFCLCGGDAGSPGGCVLL